MAKVKTNVRVKSLITSLKSEEDFDRRLIEILEGLDDRDNNINEEVLTINEPKADRTKVIPVNYLAGDFSAAAPMTCTVLLAGFHTLTYSIQDDMMEVSWFIEGVLGGAPSNQIFINVPAGKLGSGNPNRPDNWMGSHEYLDGAGVPAMGRCQVGAAAGLIQLLKAGAGNYTLGAFYSVGQVRFAIGNAINRDF